MPNHVKNIVKMPGITTLPLFSEGFTYGKSEVMFDFNRIIPMPGSLKLKAGGNEALAIEAALRSDAELRYEFNQIKATPRFSDKNYWLQIANCDKTEAELRDLGMQYINNQKLYGATTWYNWCITNWGTKWNTYGNEQPDANTITFLTAWSAPEKVIAQLAKMYPDAAIEHWWADEDIGYNTGYATYAEGREAIVDHYSPCSNTAYETYILCWGEDERLYQNENGIWQYRDNDE